MDAEKGLQNPGSRVKKFLVFSLDFRVWFLIQRFLIRKLRCVGIHRAAANDAGPLRTVRACGREGTDPRVGSAMCRSECDLEHDMSQAAKSYAVLGWIHRQHGTQGNAVQEGYTGYVE